MFYLVSGRIRKTPYMDDTVTFDAQHLVEADDEADAREIFETYYENQSSPYSVSYRADNIDVAPTLTRAMVTRT